MSDTWTLGNMHWNCACDTYCADEAATKIAKTNNACLIIIRICGCSVRYINVQSVVAVDVHLKLHKEQ